MEEYIPLKFQQVRIFTILSVIFVSTIICPKSWAAQDAIVTTEKAIIYADEQMSAAVGFVSKGKKIKIGDNAKNKLQVYPIIVSGKIAYIRVIDVSTEKESADAKVLVAERFQEGTRNEHTYNYVFSVFNYSTQIDMNEENGELKNKDPVNWYGASIRGGMKVSPKWDFDIIINYLAAEAEQEEFRMVEVGFGSAIRIIDQTRFKMKAFLQFLLVPFSSYALEEDFRVNAYGFSTGGGLSMDYRLGKRFGLEAYGGFFYTKLSEFETPDPFQPIAPAFLGTRLGLGLTYQY
jgi:hypothetical protein